MSRRKTDYGRLTQDYLDGAIDGLRGNVYGARLGGERLDTREYTQGYDWGVQWRREHSNEQA